MSTVVTIILSSVLVIFLSIVSVIIHRQKKSEYQQGYTYWFTNVDELL